MTKLGIKIIISYVILALTATLVFLYNFKYDIINSIEEEKKNYLNEYVSYIGDNIFHVLDEENLNNPEFETEEYVIDLSNFSVKKHANSKIYRILGNKEKQLYSMLSKAQEEYTIKIYNNNHRVKYIFKNHDKEDKIAKEDIDDYLKINRVIYSLQDKSQKIGYIDLVSKDEKVGNLKREIYKSMYKAFLVTMVIALILSLVFETSIVGPMSDIRENIKNITLFKKLEWKDIKTGDELEKINKELFYITNKLQKTTQEQKEFFQNTSHELKTPLMSIQGYAEAIKDGILEGEEKDKGIDIIIDESRKLSEMITSIIYMSYLSKDDDKKNLFKNRVSIYDEIEKCKITFDINLKEKNIKVENRVSKEVEVFQDFDKINKLFSNLFSNAIRYAKDLIVVESFIYDKYYKITFYDNGKGFDYNNIDRIFDRFYKGENGKNGLGLSIVKSIVESFDGKITAYNSPYGGAIIEVQIPKV